MTIDEIKKGTEGLSLEEKRELVEDLIDSNSPSDYWVSDEEVHQRVKQLESGEAEEISFEVGSRKASNYGLLSKVSRRLLSSNELS